MPETKKQPTELERHVKRLSKTDEQYKAELAATRVTKERVWPPVPTDGVDDKAPPAA